MTPALLLGLRLASGTPGQRGRSVLTGVAAGVGTLVLLVVMAMVAAPQVSDWFGYSPELLRFQAAVVSGVALPVLALAATVGRLSASIRDRRLANLRLVGLTAAQTRAVAAVESGVAAVAGTVAGLAAFLLLRLVPGTWSLAGLEWRLSELRPSATSYAMALVGVPLAVVAVSSLPQRLDTRRALERARKADAGRLSWWRVAPVLLGIALCLVSWRANDDHSLSDREIVVLFAGVGVTGIGLLLVVPVFVRLLADGLLRVARGPATVIAARRLQAQPAAVTRVVSALMIGLFLVVGARAVVAAFEGTSQYLAAEQQVTTQQWAVVVADAEAAQEQARIAARTVGVRDVVPLPWLVAQDGPRYRPGRGANDEVYVGTCSDLAHVMPEATGCVDGEPLWLYPFGERRMPSRITVAPGDDDERRNGRGPQLTLQPGTRVAGGVGGEVFGPVGGGLLLPPDTPGLAPVLDDAQRHIVVIARPGRDLADNLSTSGASVQYTPGLEDYDFVAGLRVIVYTLAVVILSLGLLTFGIAAIDRALGRRRELASLQVIGTPSATLRRAQWVEAALPTTLGTLLAIASGAFAGLTYLRLDGEWSRHLDRLVPPVLTVAGAAVLASVAVAALTVVATNGRLTSDLIRTE